MKAFETVEVTAPTGEAIYVYGIQYDRSTFTLGGTGLVSDMHLFFEMDGENVVDYYDHFGNDDEVDGSYFKFNTLVYQNTSLIYGHHKLTIVNGDERGNSMFLFDYAVYT